MLQAMAGQNIVAQEVMGRNIVRPNLNVFFQKIRAVCEPLPFLLTTSSFHKKMKIK
jgi:hypothetical protein